MGAAAKLARKIAGRRHVDVVGGYLSCVEKRAGSYTHPHGLAKQANASPPTVVARPLKRGVGRLLN